MYSISNVIFGIPLCSNGWRDEEPKWVQDLIEEELNGVLSYYHGGADHTPAAFGFEIGEFDECVAFHEGQKLLEMLTPKPEHMIKFCELFDKLEDDLKEKIKSFGNPRIFVLQSTS